MRIDENGAASSADAVPEAVVAEAQPAPQLAPATTTNAAPRRTSLPKTGSDLGFIALLSALSLAGALGARQVGKRVADGSQSAA
jgi:hypothetical protein